MYQPEFVFCKYGVYLAVPIIFIILKIFPRFELIHIFRLDIYGMRFALFETW